MNAGTGVIKTHKKLDFEKKPNYIIHLKVWNSVNFPGNFSLSTLIVNVTDVNEPPYFTEPTCLRTRMSCQYTMEENKIGEVVQVNASDPDNAKCSLTYEIVSSDKQYFKIDSRSGSIVTKENGLDRELNLHYQIVIAVFDCGKPRLHEEKKIILTVTDENDNFPIFAENHNKDIEEDTKISSSVLKVTATGEKRKH